MKPASSARLRLLLAACIWAVVGVALAAVGLRRLLAAGGVWPWTLPVALGAGWLKARLALAPRAEANARRILAAGDGRCIGGVFSWPAWAFVLAMALAGATLRRSPLPQAAVGWLYVAVGAGLLGGARVPWRLWRAGAGGVRPSAAGG